MKDFRSDNTLGCSPEIIEALARAGRDSHAPYGHDPFTDRLRSKASEIFERDVDVFPVATGTAGNGLAIAAMTPPWGAVFCHEEAHIHRDEMGAPEFFSQGAKLIPLAGPAGRIDPADLDRSMEDVGGSGRMAKPAVVSLTQATEAGTVYEVETVAAVCDVARRHAAGVHVDGARFANAVVASGASPAELTWRAGVDVLIFGATKNGVLAAELIVLFRKELAGDMAPRLHRSGHRLSKMRFLSAQLEAYLTDDLWLRNARRANAAAARLADGLRKNREIKILFPVEANILFARFPEGMAERLRADGFEFYDMPPYGRGAVRLVTGFSTGDDDVDALVAAAS